MNMIKMKELGLIIIHGTRVNSQNRSNWNDTSKEFNELLEFFSENVPGVFLTELDHTPIERSDKVIVPKIGFHIGGQYKNVVIFKVAR